MKKLLLFPYHPDIVALLENEDALRNVKIIGILSYIEDESIIRPLNRAIGADDADYFKLISICDALIMLDNYRNLKDGKYYQVIEDALNYGKEIYITSFAQTQLELDCYQGKYKTLEHPTCGSACFVDKYKDGDEIKMYEINIPVIGVLAMGKHCDKFRTQLILKEILEKEFKTIAVTSNALGALFGCYVMPPFLYGKMPFQEKVVLFNHYIYTISKQDRPDVIIIGIPEGILPFERQEFHHFAEYPLVAATAVKFDMTVFCTYFLHDVNIDRLKGLIAYCENKLNTAVDAAIISRTYYELPQDDSEKISYEFLDDDYMQKHCLNLSIIDMQIAYMLDRDKVKSVLNTCIQRLEENIDAM